MKQTKFFAAILAGAMMVTMAPQVLMADETDTATTGSGTAAECEGDDCTVTTDDSEENEPIPLNDIFFPDENFRTYIAQNIDTDGNLELSEDEIQAAKKIMVDNLDISDLTGIQYFAYADTLSCSGNSLTSLDVSGMSELTTFNCYNNQISTLNIEGLSKVKMFQANRNALTEIDISGLTSAMMICLDDNHLTELNAMGLDSLRILSCSENDLESLFVGSESLAQIVCNDNNLTGLDVTRCPELESIWCQHNNISVLDLRQNDLLKEDAEKSTVEDFNSSGDVIVYTRPSETSENVNIYCLIMDSNVNAVFSESTPTPTPSAAPTAAPTDIPDEGGVAGFVERLYSVALGRRSDEAGKQNWINAITSGQNTGADAARGFLLSPEFLNKDMSTSEFVDVLYRTFFGREPDQNGHDAWVAAINNGASKEEVIDGFINSTEWANLCLSYGIASGGTGVPNVDIEPNQATIDFATRLYTTCLNRAADETGLMAWARQLANQRDTGTGAARGFFFSSEFTNQNVSNGEYVIRLYRTFMGREPDQAGYDAWVGQLDSGVSREEVFDGFAQSNEFGVICAQYGILR